MDLTREFAPPCGYSSTFSPAPLPLTRLLFPLRPTARLHAPTDLTSSQNQAPDVLRFLLSKLAIVWVLVTALLVRLRLLL